MQRRQLLQCLPGLPAGLLGLPGLSHGSSASAAWDGAAIQRAADELDLHSLMVWQRGTLVLQHHRRSRDRPIGDWFASEVSFGPDVLHDMRSISKSVIGLMVGQAVGRGEFQADQPVLDFFPELSRLRDGARNGLHDRITVTHLLNMASGLAWAEAVTTYGTPANDETALWSDPAPWRYILDRAVEHPPGTHWNYNGGSTVLLAEILRRRSGKPWLDLAREHLFKPLGITRFEWRSGSHGQPLAYAGLRLSASDLLTLGRVMLDGGRWQGQAVVPSAWVEASLQPQVRRGEGTDGYSHQWWTGTVAGGARELPVTAALGNGGQRLFIVPVLDLAVVFTAGQYNSATIGRGQSALLRQIVATL
jgi:CubicO group peptidase (beta-lactamase class C family)